MALLYFTLHYSHHGSTSFNLSLLHSTTALLHSTCLHYSTKQGSTDSTWIYCILPWLYTSLYFNLHYSTMALLYITLPCLYFIKLDSTTFYHSSIIHSTWLYITLKWLHFPLLDSIHYYTMAVFHSTWLYITLHSTSLYLTLRCSAMAVYFALLDSTSLFHGSTSLYLNLYCILP